MDLLSQHEAFLRAIFDAPGDDTPRLVYADFLQENGEENRAVFIRTQCEQWHLQALSDNDPERAKLEFVFTRLQTLRELLVRSHPALMVEDHLHIRGFRLPGFACLDPHQPNAPDDFREWVVFNRPEWFGAPYLKTNPGLFLGASDVDRLLRAPAFQRVHEIDFSGHIEELSAGSATAGAFALIDIVQHPAISTAAVEALAHHRGVRRITSLNLTRNNLDNDAARALVKSPYLDNLKRLQLLEGNRLRGKVWQQVIARFGEEVVG